MFTSCFSPPFLHVVSGHTSKSKGFTIKSIRSETWTSSNRRWWCRLTSGLETPRQKDPWNDRIWILSEVANSAFEIFWGVAVVYFFDNQWQSSCFLKMASMLIFYWNQKPSSKLPRSRVRGMSQAPWTSTRQYLCVTYRVFFADLILFSCFCLLWCMLRACWTNPIFPFHTKILDTFHIVSLIFKAGELRITAQEPEMVALAEGWAILELAKFWQFNNWS